jgi:hypothetical protein
MRAGFESVTAVVENGLQKQHFKPFNCQWGWAQARYFALLMVLEHFRNKYSPVECNECGFFLRKKPLEFEVSVYSNYENAIPSS